jgi:hypothetical protein
MEMSGQLQVLADLLLEKKTEVHTEEALAWMLWKT